MTKLRCILCKKEIWLDVNKCEHCGDLFCNDHEYFARHDCRAVSANELAKAKDDLASISPLIYLLCGILASLFSFYVSIVILDVIMLLVRTVM